MKSRPHHETPNEARHEKNSLNVKVKLEVNAVKKRKYPPIGVGDMVRIYNKKPNFSKERAPVWSANRFKVERIEESHGQQFYHVAGRDRPLLRHEILLVP